MATCDKEFERNLSDDLSQKEKEEKSSSCEEKYVAIGDENNTKSCSSDLSLDRNEGENLTKDDLECTDKNNIKCSQNTDDNADCNTNNAANEPVETKKEGCSVSGGVEGAKLDDFSTPRSSGQRVDEALLEEDEEISEDEEEHYESAEEHLTPEEAEERMKEALELKKEGNDHFRKQEYVEGKDFYSRAIKRCPKEFTENKSVFYANRAACFQKLEEFENAISDCSQALELAPDYLKARLRRAQCYEKVEKLEEALEDYKIVFEKDKSSQPAREAIMRLPEEIKIKHEKLKEEMIGKLKELGNMVLRPFGLSTDNFNLQQDQNSGGYSINFQK